MGVILITPIFLCRDMEDQTPRMAYPVQKRPSFFSKNRLWLNVLLFIITVFSTIFVGISWSINYKYAEYLGEMNELPISIDLILDPQILLLSVLYAVVLLGILLGHEFGHFLTCRYYNIDATLPFFIPAPTLIGTMGAFIKIKSPITRKRQLFDIGVAGPLTGFILAVPTLFVGLSLSKVIAPLPREGSFILGEPLVLKIFSSLLFRGVPPESDMILHPIAFAGWVGILVTAFNLFPIGQLDGGHVFYALLGKKSIRYSRYILFIFVFLGIFFWIGWLFWALLISVLGLKHPRILDEDTPLSRQRRVLGIVVLLIFILSFIPDPIKGYNLLDLFNSFSF